MISVRLVQHLVGDAIQQHLLVRAHIPEVLQELIVLICRGILALMGVLITPLQVNAKEQLLLQIPVLAVQLVGPLSLLAVHTMRLVLLYTDVQTGTPMTPPYLTTTLTHMVLR